MPKQGQVEFLLVPPVPRDSPAPTVPTNLMLETLAQSWLALQCQMIPNVRTGAAAFEVNADEDFDATVGWPEERSAEPGLLEVARLALRQQSPVAREPERHDEEQDVTSLYLACPLQRDGQLFGAVAIHTEVLPAEQQRAALQLLQWGAAWLELLLRGGGSSQPASLPVVFDVMVAGLKHERFEAAATAAATELAHRLSCERVSLGFGHTGRVRVQVVSHSAQFEHRANLIRSIESAMNEALVLGTTVTQPPSRPESAQASPAHGQLADQEGQEAICSVLLSDHDRAVGVITLERTAARPFDAASTDFCEAVAALLGPILEMKRRQDRPPVVKFRDAVRSFLGRLAGPRELRLKLGAALLIGLAGFLALAVGEYRVSAPAALEGTIQRAVVAPYDGYIAAAHVRAGEAVHAGDILAELDDKDLRLEHRKWTSEREELRKQFRKALAELDHAEARILTAQVSQAEAQMALVDEQLARTRLVAPFDGLVISGDLSRALGTPVERGEVLFEVAPLDGYRVVLEVDERDIADVAAGQHGHLALSAMPGDRFPLVVEKVSTVSQTEEGLAAFRVEARLDGPSGHLRPGMQGIGKIVAGERKLIWIWTRRLVGWVQLWLWSWWP